MYKYIEKLSYSLSSMVENTTPQLFSWILIQNVNGKPYEHIEMELISSGWPEAIVKSALLYAKGEHHFQPNIQIQSTQNLLAKDIQYNADKNKIITAPNFPGILFDNYPNKVNVGDKDVDILLSINHPRIIVFDNFLSDEECNDLIKISQSKLSRSKTMGVENYAIPEPNDDRTSSGTFLLKNENKLLPIIDKRISKLVNWNVSWGDVLQILRYQPGQQYKPHYDYFTSDYVEKNRKISHLGQRVGTVIMYLNNVAEGGHTIFPETGINIHPKKGSALFFSYNDDPSSLSLHGGSPVVSGEKWVATKWLRTL